MEHTKKYLITLFIILVLLFFVPSIPQIANAMVNAWHGSLVAYWVLLTVIAIVLGFKSVRGVKQ